GHERLSREEWFGASAGWRLDGYWNRQERADQESAGVAGRPAQVVSGGGRTSRGPACRFGATPARYLPANAEVMPRVGTVTSILCRIPVRPRYAAGDGGHAARALGPGGPTAGTN